MYSHSKKSITHPDTGTSYRVDHQSYGRLCAKRLLSREAILSTDAKAWNGNVNLTVGLNQGSFTNASSPWHHKAEEILSSWTEIEDGSNESF
jgi:hypothetical protein